MKNPAVLRFVIAIICALLFNNLLSAQSNPAAVLKEARELNKKADELVAKVFSNSEYKKAVSSLADAEEYSLDPSKSEKMINALNTAVREFRTSIENAKKLAPDFQTLLKTRYLVTCLGVELTKNKPFNNGDDEFISAVEDFIDKDNEGVRKYSEKASNYYREAEMIAIKEKYYGRLLSAIERSDDQGVPKFAPQTYNKVVAMSKEIQTIIDLNKYDTLKARAILDQANYELNHALYMKDLFSSMKSSDKTFEDLQLIWEEPLAKIGAEYKLPRSFDKGFDVITKGILENISSDKNIIASLKKENEDTGKKHGELQKLYDECKTTLAQSVKLNNKYAAELDSLKKAVADLKTEKNDLKAKFDALESERSKYKNMAVTGKLNEAITSISEMFTANEAEIFPSGDSITIRLVSLSYPAKSSSVESRYNPLLTKVSKAIQSQPNAAILVFGYCDDYAGDEPKNVELSTARAEAVAQHLAANTGLDPAKFVSKGFGNSKPISKVAEKSKAKNNRIEIYILPSL